MFADAFVPFQNLSVFAFPSLFFIPIFRRLPCHSEDMPIELPTWT